MYSNFRKEIRNIFFSPSALLWHVVVW